MHRLRISKTVPLLRLLAIEHGRHAGFLGADPTGDQDLDVYWGECRVVQFRAALAFNERSLMI
jgi:hypothetical protein